MRIELIWPRPDAQDRTLTFDVPAARPVSDLLRPVLRHTRRACSPAALGRAIGYAEPFLGTAANAAGMGPLARLALPVVARMARQSLHGTASAAETSQASRIPGAPGSGPA